MLRIILETTKTAEKAIGRGYLAKLSLGVRGSIERSFAPLGGKERNRRWYEMTGIPGDIFESKRPLWTGEAFVARTAWFGVQADGSLFELSRVEAFASVENEPILTSSHETTLPAKRRAERFEIAGVAAIPTDAPPRA